MVEDKDLNQQPAEVSMVKEDPKNTDIETVEAGKSFTQSDIDAAVAAALANANKDIELRIENAKAEAARLAAMDEQERQAEEQRIERETFAKEKAAFAAEKLKLFAERTLSAAGLPVTLAGAVTSGDEETTQANINALAEKFKNAVASGIKEKLAGKTPRGSGGAEQSENDKMKADITNAMKRGF